MKINDLTGEQRRQLIDSQQAWSAWRLLNNEKRRRFAGGMRWAARASGEYLLRKIGSSEKSLGPRGPKTEKAYESFKTGRASNKEALQGIAKRLDEMAPVNRALGLGRMPLTPARVLRECDARELLGDQLFVVGTNALYAYEAMAGIRFDSGLLATADIDLLYDARQRMSIVARVAVSAKGLIGVLQNADRSFAATRSRGYQAVNKDGYLVDLIRPEGQNVFHDNRIASLSDMEGDLEGAAIFGLDWLINAPKVETVVIDERGYPAPVTAIDPRVYALYKFWLSERKDRSKIKTRRDLEQARAVFLVAKNYLQLDFEALDLSALPEALRRAPAGIALEESGPAPEAPDW